jgi:hypothetical protein
VFPDNGAKMLSHNLYLSQRERLREANWRNRGYPITVTLIRYLFLFRVDSPGETSPVTWGFEKAKVKVSIKVSPLTSHTDQKVPRF